MTKPKGMEEYDGYEIEAPRIYTPEEQKKADEQIAELRKKINQANSKPSK